MSWASDNVSLLWNWFPWKNSFVVIPLCWMCVNIVLACGLSQITSSNDSRQALYDQGLRMIGLITSASISIVTLTFSLTVLSVQLASQTYSPRLLDDFLKDPASKMVIAVNLGAYVYCYTLNYFMDGINIAAARVPYVAIHFLSVHCGIVLLSFVYFIHVFINGFRIETILKRASDSSITAARALSSLNNVNGTSSSGNESSLLLRDDFPDVPNRAIKVSADESGYIVNFNFAAIVQQAAKLDICIRYTHQVGDYVNRGTVLCHVWDCHTREHDDQEVKLGKRVIQQIDLYGQDAIDDKDRTYEQKVEKRLGELANQGVCFKKERSSDLDVTLGLQQLSDIAVRALSPGVNDPHTAIQCMDALTGLLATLARMPLGLPNARDDQGHLRICAPRRSFSYLLSMLDSIRRYGGSDLSVCRRGLRMFGDLGVIITQIDRLDVLPTILAQLEQWMLVSENNFPKGSPELKSLQELHEHIKFSIADSENVVLDDEEGAAKDFQEFETTYNKEGEDGGVTESQRDRSMVSAFLDQVVFAKTSKKEEETVI